MILPQVGRWRYWHQTPKMMSVSKRHSPANICTAPCLQLYASFHMHVSFSVVPCIDTEVQSELWSLRHWAEDISRLNFPREQLFFLNNDTYLIERNSYNNFSSIGRWLRSQMCFAIHETPGEECSCLEGDFHFRARFGLTGSTIYVLISKNLVFILYLIF